MEFDRKEKARSLFMELTATFIREEANTNPLITVTDVHMSPSSQDVKVFFTTIPDNKEGDALIFLMRKAGELRQYLKKNARLKFIPHIVFEIDRGERHRQHIDEIVHDLEDDTK